MLHWNFLWDRKSHVQKAIGNMQHYMVLKEEQASLPGKLIYKVQ